MSKSLLRLLAIFLAFGLIAAACGDDDDAEESTESTDEVEDAGEGETEEEAPEDDAEGDMDEEGHSTDLASVCPAEIVIQTDWNPESEHGALYQMVGKDGYTIDAGSAIVSGDLVAGGEDTGVDIEVRSGGPAIGFQQVTAQMYQDSAITFGYVSTDEAISNATELPTISFVAPLDINPQMIMWDPETYPEVEGIADLATATDGGVIIRYFGTATYMPDLVSRGVVLESQLDGSYDGSPAVFVAEGGAIAQQGFASAEPYIYQNEVEQWGKPVAFELIHDIGLEAYAAAIAATPETFDELSASGCLAAITPIIQQAQVDYANDPAATNELIIELVAEYDNGWIYGPEVAEFSLQTQLELGLIGNAGNDTLGDFDLERVQRVIDTLAGSDVGFEVPEGLTPEDLVTNEFIDESIGL